MDIARVRKDSSGLALCFFATDVYHIEKDEAELGDVSRQLEASPIAQLVRAPH